VTLGSPAAADDVREAADALRRALGERRPRIAITLGSGLGGLTGRFDDRVEVPYSGLPGWPQPTVEGHAGEAILGRLGGVDVLGLSGRAHMYEGHEPARVAFYVRVLGVLGVPALFLSNAAGAIHHTFQPGDLMLLADHMNLMFRSPLIGPVQPGETRFPDMSAPYDPALRSAVRETASELRLPLREGVYAGLLGPTYETPAEIRMLKALGADAVGMSTVPEVLTARALGIRCVAVSCLTNLAAGVSPQPLDHAEVLETGLRVADDFERLVERSIARFDRDGLLP
jgi:purine-nucleoside phosphorylase